MPPLDIFHFIIFIGFFALFRKPIAFLWYIFFINFTRIVIIVLLVGVGWSILHLSIIWLSICQWCCWGSVGIVVQWATFADDLQNQAVHLKNSFFENSKNKRRIRNFLVQKLKKWMKNPRRLRTFFGSLKIPKVLNLKNPRRLRNFFR